MKKQMKFGDTKLDNHALICFIYYCIHRIYYCLLLSGVYNIRQVRICHEV